jgi:hypothetical protein
MRLQRVGIRTEQLFAHGRRMHGVGHPRRLCHNTRPDRSESRRSASDAMCHMYGPAARSKMAFEIDERESCNNVFGL